MGAFAGDLVHADGVATGADEGLLRNIRNGLQSSCQGHHFKNGAGNIAGLGESIHVDAFVSVITFVDSRHIVGIIIRCGHRTKDLTGFIVIHSNGAMVASHSLQGRCLRLCRQGQAGNTFVFTVTVDTVKQVKTCHFFCVFRHSRCADIAQPVTQPMDGCFTKGFRVRVGAALQHIQKKHIVRIHHNATTDIIAVVHVWRTLEHSPAAGVDRKADHKQQKTCNQGADQGQQDQGTFCNFMHLPHLLCFLPGESQSWHSGGYPQP